MPRLGAHMSIAGGFEKAVERAADAGCDCVQIFTKNNNQWRARPIDEEEVAKFRRRLVERRIVDPIAHSSYLINLASPDPVLWSKSVDAMVIELQRAQQLGLAYVVVHPGSHTTASESEGIGNIIRALDEVHSRTPDMQTQILLETTAGQGSNLGWRFEQLAAILEGVQSRDRLGTCFDSCHVFAAGYGLSTKADYDDTMREFDTLIGLSRIKAFHLNDSKREAGSRVDRHENIGEGHLGIEPFRWLLNDKRFDETPMYLETPKGTNDSEEDWDVVNLRVLRGLVE